MARKRVITVYMTPVTEAALKRLAILKKTTQSKLMREGLDLVLAKHENKGPTIT